MAYDPKSYLDQALKTGLQPTYSIPASPEAGNIPEYRGDVANIGNVEVRTVLDPVYEGYGDAQNQIGTQQTGYMVSVPLTGQYEGYYRNDIYDNEGNFVKTGFTEPDNDKYWLKGLAQLALTAASFGGLGPIASAAANAYKGIQALKGGDVLGAAASILPGVGYIPGVSSELANTLKTAGGYAKTASALEKAIKSKDILGALGAASDIPGVPKVPGEITGVLKDIGQANRIREAISGENPNALFREIVRLSKTGVPFSKLADITGEDAIPNFFDEGGPGYEGVIIPDWDVLPEPRVTADDWYQEGVIPTYSGVPEWDDALDIALQTGVTPSSEADQTAQVINITGKRETPDFTEVPDRTPGSPTDTTPGAVTPDDDRTVGTTPGTGGTKPTTPGTKPTTPGTPKSGMDLAALFALLGAMGGNQGNDVRTPAQSNIARGTPESPFGLMYDLRG